MRRKKQPNNPAVQRELNRLLALTRADLATWTDADFKRVERLHARYERSKKIGPRQWRRWASASRLVILGYAPNDLPSFEERMKIREQAEEDLLRAILSPAPGAEPKAGV